MFFFPCFFTSDAVLLLRLYIFLSLLLALSINGPALSSELERFGPAARAARGGRVAARRVELEPALGHLGGDRLVVVGLKTEQRQLFRNNQVNINNLICNLKDF